MGYDVSATAKDLLVKLGLQAYSVGNQPGVFVRPAPQMIGQNPNPNYRPLSKSVAFMFGNTNGNGGPDGVMTSLDNKTDSHVALESLPIRLYTKTGPMAKVPFTLAVEYFSNKGFKVYEEASETEREFQKSDPDILEQREKLRLAKIAKAERNGMAVMQPGDAVRPLVEAIQAMTAQNAAGASRGPGRPPKGQGTDD